MAAPLDPSALLDPSPSTSQSLLLDYFNECRDKYHIVKLNSHIKELLSTLDVNSNVIEVKTYVGNRNLICLCDLIKTHMQHVVTVKFPSAQLYLSDDKPGTVSGNVTVQAICSKLARHPSLTRLDLSHNGIGTDGLREVIHLVKSTPTLVTVFLEGNPLTTDQLNMLQCCLELNRRREKKKKKGMPHSTLSSVVSGMIFGNNIKSAASPYKLPPPPPATPPTSALHVASPQAASPRELVHSTVSLSTTAAGANGGRPQKRPYIGIRFERSNRHPYRLSEMTMHCVRQRSATARDDVASRWPRILSNLPCAASSDGKSHPPPADKCIKSLDDWRHTHFKTDEERQRVVKMLRNSTLFQAFHRAIFVPPPRPEEKKSAPSYAVFGPLVAETDFEEAIGIQESQTRVILEQLVDTMELFSYRDGDLVCEVGDKARYVYLIDSHRSPDAVAVIHRPPVSLLASTPSNASEPPRTPIATPLASSVVRPANAGASFNAAMSLNGPVGGASTLPSGGVSVSLNNGTCTFPAGQFFLYDELLPLDSYSIPSDVRTGNCTVTRNNGSATCDSDDARIFVWALRKEAFQLFLAEPICQHRMDWRRLVDAMPAFLGYDSNLRATLCDVLHSTTVNERDLPNGAAGTDTLAIDPHLLSSNVVLIEEGHLLVRRKGDDVRDFGRADVISLSGKVTDPHDVKVYLQSGNMPAWKFILISHELLNTALPHEVRDVLMVKCASTFERVETMHELAASTRKKKLAQHAPRV